MSRFAVAVLIAAFAAAVVASPSDAASRRKHAEKHPTEIAAASAPDRYGLPSTYYPAPPFPFFLLPGPWWLPAHP